MSKTFTGAEVASHNTASDLWIILNEEVYDVTEFQKTHPGGEKILVKMGGKDATRPFRKLHNERILKSDQYKGLCIGKVGQGGDGVTVRKGSIFGKLFGKKIEGVAISEAKVVVVESEIGVGEQGEILESNSNIKVLKVTDQLK